MSSSFIRTVMRKAAVGLRLAALVALLGVGAAPAMAQGGKMTIGVNLSGAEFGRGGKRYGTDYEYPGAVDLDYYQSKGVNLVRLPFKWERMQPVLGAPLDRAELDRLNTFLTAANARGVKVIVDLHNYGRYGDKVVGTPDLPAGRLADVWTKLAAALKDNPAVAGYDLMNEPHDMGAADWPAAVQLTVNAIRTVDMKTPIYVEGTGWASASQWPKNNPNIIVKDPANRVIYEAHIYFDKDATGTYKGSYDQEGANPNIGVTRIKPFLDWLKQHNVQGFIGEFNVPDNDPRWAVVLDNTLAAMKAAGVSGTLWGGGARWGATYSMNLRKAGGGDTGQMELLTRKYLTPPANAAIVGSNGDDGLTGTAQADVILGHRGKDAIDGAAGDDRLIGGQGPDRLTGGPGKDTFVYGGVSDSTPANPDLITDLKPEDVIDLSRIDADSRTPGDQAFRIVPAFTRKAGEMTIIYDAAKGVTAVNLDVNGDGAPEAVILLTGDQRAFKSFSL